VLQFVDIHAALDVLAVGEVVPEVQFVHDAVPDAFLYLPVTHAVHVPPFGPV